MSDTNKKPSAVEKAAEEFKTSEASFKAAEKAKEDAVVAFSNLTDTATPEQKAAAESLMTETRSAFEAISKTHGELVSKRELGKTKEVRILLPVAGKFFLPYDIDQVVELPANQADELVDAKYAEHVK